MREIVPGDIYIPHTAVFKLEKFHENGIMVFSDGAEYKGSKTTDEQVLLKRISAGRYKSFFKDMAVLARKGDIYLIPQSCPIMKALDVNLESKIVKGIGLRKFMKYLKDRKEDEKTAKIPPVIHSLIDSIDVIISPRGDYDKVTFRSELFERAHEIMSGFR